jgi:threonine synthase
MATRALVVTGYAPAELRRAVAAALAVAMAEKAPAVKVDTERVYEPDEESTAMRGGAILVAIDDAAGVFARKKYPYNVRAIATATSTAESLTAYVLEGLLNQPMRRFVSSRADLHPATPGPTVGFLSAVRRGIAPDGGLFLPEHLPAPYPSDLLEFLCTSEASADYATLAQILLERIVDRNDVPPGVLQAMIAAAYDPAAWDNSATCCPVADVTFPEAKTAGVHVALSKQYCGPTSAFKDFALQLFPRWFELATIVDEDDAGEAGHAAGGSKYLILAATSGDTGGAAINGFVRGAPDTKIMVLYPTAGVSPVQRLQMLSMNGGNVRVVAVDGDFDFCQSTVKQIFGTQSIADRLAKEADTRLSSANSINWGRLLPQVVYYFANYAALVRAGKLAFGEQLDVCIPTGNFGNILACYLAKRLGLPVGRLILASNKNDVLHEFVATGTYDIEKRQLGLTASPSIDILKASNVERFLHLATNGSGAAVVEMMNSLAHHKKFVAPAEVRDELKRCFWSGRCDEQQCRDTIKRTYDESKEVIDPHTAVAMHVARQYLASDAVQMKAKVLLVASTAHWAKFPEPVAEALGVVTSAGLKGNAATAAETRQLFQAVVAACPEAKVSAPLAKIFEHPELLEAGPRLPASIDAIVADLLAFAGAKEQQ